MLPGLPRRLGGASLAAISQAEAVARHHEVHVLVLGQPDMTLLAMLRRRLPCEVHNVQGAPRTVDRHIRELLLRIRADVVQAESLAGAEWISDPRRLGPRTVYRAYDATFAVIDAAVRSPVNAPATRVGRFLEHMGLRRRLLAASVARLRRREMRVARRFDRVLCFSHEDRETFRGQGIHAGVVSLPMDPNPKPHRPDPSPVFRMAFVATFTYFPNVDALAFLLNEIVPALPCDLAWRLDVVGAEPPAFASLSADRGPVRVLGYVDDLEDTLGATDAFLVPLRFGGGVKLKTMTALRRGIATVSTHAGCTGLAVQDGEHILVRDTASDFAQALQALAASRGLRESIGDAGRRFMAEAHAPRIIAEALGAEYEGLINRAQIAPGSHLDS